MGRPPKPTSQRRTERVTLNLTKGEWRDLEALAGEQSLSDFLRALALRSLARRTRKP